MSTPSAPAKRILLIVAGGIAAFKSLELIRRTRERGYTVRTVLTEAGAAFVTPLSLAALSGDKVYSQLFSLTDESEMGHIRLAREADLVVVAPATANLMAKLAAGIADDLATTVLIATDKPVLMAPAMNVEMWAHAATQRSLVRLKADGVLFVGPDAGDLACGEVGAGRMAEPADILAAIETLVTTDRPLEGRRALVTSGPTREPIDPVRYISNRSSGKQGHAIAGALARLGAETTLITGPTAEPDPAAVRAIHIETAAEMLAACEAALPADVAVCAAAVADWHVAEAGANKLKKGRNTPSLTLIENPDILASLAGRIDGRPRLVVGFAAETEDLLAAARAKLERKRCDWILANDVSAADTFGGDDNTVHLITAEGTDSWPRMTKAAIAERLAQSIGQTLSG